MFRGFGYAVWANGGKLTLKSTNARSIRRKQNPSTSRGSKVERRSRLSDTRAMKTMVVFEETLSVQVPDGVGAASVSRWTQLTFFGRSLA